MKYLKDGALLWGVALVLCLLGLCVKLWLDWPEARAMERTAAAFGVPLAAFGLAWGHFFKAQSTARRIFHDFYGRAKQERRQIARKLLREYYAEASGIFWGVRLVGALFIAAVAAHVWMVLLQGASTGFATLFGLIVMAIGNIWGNYFERAVEIRARLYPEALTQQA